MDIWQNSSLIVSLTLGVDMLYDKKTEEFIEVNNINLLTEGGPYMRIAP